MYFPTGEGSLGPTTRPTFLQKVLCEVLQNVERMCIQTSLVDLVDLVDLCNSIMPKGVPILTKKLVEHL